MPDFSSFSLEELKAELEKSESLLVDAQDERAFLGKQANQHIKMSEFDRLDRDIARYGERVSELKKLIETKGG